MKVEQTTPDCKKYFGFILHLKYCSAFKMSRCDIGIYKYIKGGQLLYGAVANDNVDSSCLVLGQKKANFKYLYHCIRLLKC